MQGLREKVLEEEQLAHILILPPLLGFYRIQKGYFWAQMYVTYLVEDDLASLLMFLAGVLVVSVYTTSCHSSLKTSQLNPRLTPEIYLFMWVGWIENDFKMFMMLINKILKGQSFQMFSIFFFLSLCMCNYYILRLDAIQPNE